MAPTPSVDEYVDHLRALQAMPHEVARALRERLLAERAWIDSQLLMVETSLEREPSNGEQTAPPPAPADPNKETAPPMEEQPTRRAALLKLMAADPDRDWLTAEMRAGLVRQKILPDTPKGTHSFHSLIQKLKKRGEVVSAGERRWRITGRGATAARRLQ